MSCTSDPTVKARLNELKGKAAEKAVVTAQSIADQLDEDRALAHDKGQLSAAVSATMGKAKVLGLLKEQVEHDVSSPLKAMFAAFCGTGFRPRDDG